MLKQYVNLRCRIDDFEKTSRGYKGKIYSAKRSDIELIKILKSYIPDAYIFEKEISKAIDFDNIEYYLNKEVFIESASNELNYYEEFNIFLKGNKLKVNHSPYYIHEYSYFSDDTNKPQTIVNYESNLLLIKLLTDVADYKKETGIHELELFFYKSGNGTDLLIDYVQEDLNEVCKINAIKELDEHFNSKSDKQERKQIFKNELINLLNKEDGSYSVILKQWDFLIDNYRKSFDLYLSGFSFEKIKTSSVEHFHNLSNKINDTIAKVSNYIFAVPIAFIFLIKQLDFTGKSFENDTLMLVLGGLFFVLIWFVPFKNIKESINAVEDDIDSYIDKIKGNKTLIDIENKLELLKTKKLKSQKRKLKITKFVSVLILLIFITSYFYIYCDFRL